MYRPEIDGLRALAVLAVIVGHFDSNLLPNGHLGVDIFFVISGFVITQSLVSRNHETLKSFLSQFYTRRAKRLLPALVFCVAVTFLIFLLLVNPESSQASSYKRTAIAALFGVSNMYLLGQAMDYFGSSALLNPFTHTWSLGVEEQFYLLFPLLIWFSGYTKNAAGSERRFAWLIGVTGVLSFLVYIWLSRTGPVHAFYLMPARFWELAVGAAAYVIYSRLQNVDAPSLSLATSSALFMLVLLIATLFLSSAYHELALVAVVLLTAILIVVIKQGSLAYKLLTVSPVVFIGVISYSLYLWHWSVITLSRWTVGISSSTVPFQIALIFLLSIASYLYIEKPLRRADWGIAKVGPVNIGPLSKAVLIVLGITLVLLQLSRYHMNFYAGTPAPLIKSGVHTLLDNASYQERYTWKGSECVLQDNKDVGKIILVENCTFGDFASSSRRFLVIGSSYSAAEIEMYKVIVDKGLGSVSITSSWGASIVPELKNTTEWSRANEYYWNEVLPSLFRHLKAGDVILMINDGRDFLPEVQTRKSMEQLSTLHQGLKRFAGELSERGIGLIYQHAIPFMLESACTPDAATPQWWHLIEPPCNYYTREASLARRKPYDDILLQMQKDYDNFYVLDLFDLFCGGEVCKFYNQDGVFLYRDEWSHPGIEASKLAQPLLLDVISEAIRQQ